MSEGPVFGSLSEVADSKNRPMRFSPPPDPPSNVATEQAPQGETTINYKIMGINLLVWWAIGLAFFDMVADLVLRPNLYSVCASMSSIITMVLLWVYYVPKKAGSTQPKPPASS